MSKEDNSIQDELKVISKPHFKIDPDELSKPENERQSRYVKFLTDAINQQSTEMKNLSAYYFESIEQFKAHVFSVFDKFNNNELPLKGAYMNDGARFVRELLSTSWFDLKHDVTYEGDSFEKMSAGKKAFVVLKLTLDFSKRTCPILIDQPEDDLDNRAIYSELVTYLKKKKIERQIILVTHNSNVVVNADSELVIVANQHGSNSKNTNEKKFEYVAGSLEFSKPLNSSESRILYKKGIREHVCEILEGGGQAFKQREKKYDLAD